MFVFQYSELDQTVPDVITDFQTGVGGDRIDFSDIHAKNIAAGYASGFASQLPYSHGYIRLLQNGDSTIVGYDRDGNLNNYNLLSVVEFLGVQASDLTPANFSMVGSNFGISGTGVVAQQSVLSATQLRLSLGLWGGQPSSNVTVKVFDNTQNGAQVASATFTPGEWMNKQTVDITTPSAARIDLTKDLTLSVTSTDALYASSGLIMGVIGENLVAEKPRLIAPELSVFGQNSGTFSVQLTSNLSAAPTSATAFTLVPDNSSVGLMSASLGWQAGKPVFTLDSSISWVGTERFNAVGKINGQDVTLPVTLHNSATNSLSLTGPTSVVEGSSGTVPATFTLSLASPAGESIPIEWQIRSVSGGADASDFAQDSLPSGTVTFARGETSKQFTINVTGDTSIEPDEQFQVTILSKTPISTDLSLPQAKTVSITNDDFTLVTGTALYWKDAKPVNLVTGWSLDSSKSLDAGGHCEVRNITYDRMSGQLKAEVWLNTADVISNFDLRIAKPEGATVTTTLSSSLSSWNVVQNDAGASYAVAGLGTAGGSGPIKLMDISLSSVSPGDDVLLQRGTIGSYQLGSQNLFSSGVVLVKDGTVALQALPNQSLMTDLSGSANPETLAALDSRDALLCLKLANGTLSASSLESPYQLIAADVNKSGQITTLDAFQLLRAVVGMDSSGAAGQWQCVSADADLSGLSVAKSWDDSLVTFDNLQAHVNLVGVIIGDVDGSWSGLG